MTNPIYVLLNTFLMEGIKRLFILEKSNFEIKYRLNYNFVIIPKLLKKIILYTFSLKFFCTFGNPKFDRTLWRYITLFGTTPTISKNISR